ncbi:hypothetical protein ACOMHN_053679 [Nucella lapillus]
MDHILEGVMASGHPEAMKRQLIDKISDKGREQQSSGDVQVVLQTAISWVLNGTSELQVSSGFKLFSSWARHHPPVLDSLLTRDLLLSLLGKPCRNRANVPLLLTAALELMQKEGESSSSGSGSSGGSSSSGGISVSGGAVGSKLLVQHLKVLGVKAAQFFEDSPDLVSIVHYVRMLLRFKDSLPKGDLADRVALPLMKVLATHHIPSDEAQVYGFIMDVTSLTQTLQQVWKESSLGLLLTCLQELFSIISSLEPPHPSLALAALVRLIPTEIVKSAVSSVVHNTKVSDAAVKAALCRMIDWLVWPTCRNIDEWVICFLNELAAAKKFSMLINISQAKVEQVLDKLQYSPVRGASFNILSHMLLSFQHSPQIFHKILPKVPAMLALQSDCVWFRSCQILPKVPAMLALLEKEGSEEALLYRSKLGELLHCLMFLHTGFPDLYDPILDLIKDVACPSSDEIGRRLSERRWSAQQCRSGQSPQVTLAQKSDTGKTGLFNLGNTCYMNSILQSLFMCDDFRRQAFQRTPTLEEGLLEKLQQVFASLLLSQRPAIAPLKFLAVSRPPWFMTGQQQDCSEFLKFLLDQIHEQQLRVNKRLLAKAKVKDAKVKGAKVKDASSSSPPTKVKDASPAKVKDAKREKDEDMETDGTPQSVAAGGGGGGGGAVSEIGDVVADDDNNDDDDDDDYSYDDDENDRTLVREWFGGKMRLTSRCLSCQQESHRVEDFIDISLAFPQAGGSGSAGADNNPSALASTTTTTSSTSTSVSLSSSSSPPTLKALIGGGSHLPQTHHSQVTTSTPSSSRPPQDSSSSASAAAAFVNYSSQVCSGDCNSEVFVKYSSVNYSSQVCSDFAQTSDGHKPPSDTSNLSNQPRNRHKPRKNAIHKPATNRHKPRKNTAHKPVPNRRKPRHARGVSPPPPKETPPGPSAAMHLTELLSHYLSSERMEGDNQYHCERCGRLQDGERTIGIVRCPRYLILTLLRFNYDAKTQTRSKIFREVTCPRTLALPVQGRHHGNNSNNRETTHNSSTAAKRRKKLLHHLQPRLTPTCVSGAPPDSCELYGLCSVVVHSGSSSECGHYYCFSRHSQTDDVDAVISGLDRVTATAANPFSTAAGTAENGCRAGAKMEVVEEEGGEETDVDFLQDRWCLFNDSRVSGVSFSSFRNLGKRFAKDTPYVLVYKKLSLDEGGQAAGPQDPPLRQSLRDMVNKDNSQYLKEQELAAKAKASRQRASSPSSSTFTHWRDFDSDQGPPGSCGGGGGGGGLDTSGSRFVF